MCVQARKRAQHTAAHYDIGLRVALRDRASQCALGVAHAPPVMGGTNVILAWQSVAGVSYFLERSINLAAPSAFTSVATNITDQVGSTTYIDTNAIGNGPLFYRVGVGIELPVGYRVASRIVAR
jgi:hypothetical protein